MRKSNGMLEDNIPLAPMALLSFGFAVLAVIALGDALPEAQPARLIGQCQGRILAAQSEDQFPKGCDWIEPIRLAD